MQVGWRLECGGEVAPTSGRVCAAGWATRLQLHTAPPPCHPKSAARRDDQARLAAAAADHEQRVAALRAEWEAERVRNEFIAPQTCTDRNG